MKTVVQYIVTLKVNTGGPPEYVSWSNYGYSGLIDAVESVDWDVSRGYAFNGRVDHVLPSGACVSVYERSNNV